MSVRPNSSSSTRVSTSASTSAQEVQQPKPVNSADPAVLGAGQKLSAPASDKYSGASAQNLGQSGLTSGPVKPRRNREALRSKAKGAEGSGSKEAATEAAGSVPGKPAELGGLFKDLPEVGKELAGKVPDDLKAIHADLLTARDGAPGEKVAALARLAAALPTTLKSVLGHVGVGGEVVEKVLDHPDILNNLATVLDGKDKKTSERLAAGLSLLKDLQETVPPAELVKALGKTGLQGPLDKLWKGFSGAMEKTGLSGEELKGAWDAVLGKPELITNAATAMDPEAKKSDRVAAGLGLAKDLLEVVPKGKLPGFVEKLAPGLPVAKELAGLVGALGDPEKSVAEKASASVAFAREAYKTLGSDFPALRAKLKDLGPVFKSADAAITLLDPGAGVTDKAKAALSLWGEAGAAKKGLQELGDLIRNPGQLKAISEAIDKGAAAAEKLVPEALRKDLKPADLADLDRAVPSGALREDVGKLLQKMDSADEAKALIQALGSAGTPEAQKALLAGVSTADGPTRKAMLEGLSSLEPAALRSVLTGTVDLGEKGAKPALELFQQMAAKIPDAMGSDEVKQLLKGFDGDGLKSLLKLGAEAEAKSLGETLTTLGKNVDGALVSKGVKALDGLIGKMGLKLGKEVAEKVVKNLTKMIPAAGAAPALADAFGMGKIAAETSSPEIRYLAAMGATLNLADAALGVAEAFGVGNVGLPVNVALGVAELGMDLYVGHLREQEIAAQAKGETFQAPQGLRAAIGASALATGPIGMSMLVANFGVPGSVRVLTDTAAVGGRLAIQAGEAVATLAGQGVEEGLKGTAEAINTLADVIRNPGKYGEKARELAEQGLEGLKNTVKLGGELGRQALEGLQSLASEAGEVGKQALAVIGKTMGDLKAMGEKGIEQLAWIAKNPGAAAQMAQEALAELGGKVLDTADKAAKAVGRKALEALNAVGELADAAKQKVGQLVDKALRQGGEVLKDLRFMMDNPGVVVGAIKDSMVALAAQGGELAKKALETLQGWGKQGAEMLGKVVDQAKELGKEGLETLNWLVRNPGAASQAALQGIKEMAKKTGDVAVAAFNSLVDVVKDTGAAAKEAAQAIAGLIGEGAEAAGRVLQSWGKNLANGGAEVVKALQNLGEAGGEALNAIASKMDVFGIGSLQGEFAKLGGISKRLATENYVLAEKMLESAKPLLGDQYESIRGLLATTQISGNFGRKVTEALANRDVAKLIRLSKDQDALFEKGMGSTAGSIRQAFLSGISNGVDLTHLQGKLKQELTSSMEALRRVRDRCEPGSRMHELAVAHLSDIAGLKQRFDNPGDPLGRPWGDSSWQEWVASWFVDTGVTHQIEAAVAFPL